MPNNREHSDHTLQKLGVEAADLHQWMDQPSEWAGSLHRFFRHDPDNPPEWAVKRYGFERASRIMQHHVELDDYGNINGNLITYLGDILKKEQYFDAIRSRSRYVKGKIIDIDDDMMTIDCNYEKFREGDQIGYLTINKEIINLGDVFIGGKIIGIRNYNGFQVLEGQTLELVDADISIAYDVQFDIIDKILKCDLDDVQNNLFNKIIGDDHIKPINKKILTNTMNIDCRYELDDSQINVVESILGLNEGELLLVVGPPGTGKTEVIAKAAYELSLRNERILISSHTNRAVDNVIKKLPVESTIRIGKISKIHKNVRPYTLGEKALKEKGTQLKQIEDEIEELKTNLHNMENPTIDTYNLINEETRKNTIRILRTEIKNLISTRNDLIRAEISNLLIKAKIFGSTLIKSGMTPLKNLVFDIIFIDECSQVSILLAMVGMFRAKKWVLIGDHKQLLPIFQIFNPQEHKKELRALSSFCFFKEKYEKRTLWLRHHYRSNKDIIGFSQKHIYDNNISPSDRCDDIRLKISDTLPLSKTYLSPYKPAVFINVLGTEKIDTSHSKHNLEEIDAISNIVDDIESLNLKLRDTGIITTYRSQREKLKKKIKKRFLEISTVDSYQGREKDIIIYSVTSTKNFDFIEDENRMNVAFTRAKKKLIVIGNENAILKNSPAGLLSKYISYSKSKYGYYDYSLEQTSLDQGGRDWSKTIIEI